MGSYLSRNSAEVEDLTTPSNVTYRYPPKQGNYFGSHFIMGGNKFETIQPEAFLFGENSDLNFLGPKPYNCSYKVSSPSQPVRALPCLVNIRKDSLRLVKVPSMVNKTVTNEDDTQVTQDRQITAEEGEGGGSYLYNIEFTFDADCPCSVTIYYDATEEMVNKNMIYSPQPARDCSDTVHFNAGCKQQFCLPAHRIDPCKLAVADVDWTKCNVRIPIVFQVCADVGSASSGHCHITYAEFYKPSDNTWSIRAVKQKQAINGVCYLLQEIYGIENKSASKNDDDDDDDEDDDSSDCVVCLSETRDTLILPCKHLCLCSACANQLRYQQSGCPICRQSFRALLQIRAVRKVSGNHTSPRSTTTEAESGSDEQLEGGEDEARVVVPVPEGYEVIPLIDAIKGSIASSSRSSTTNQASASTSVDNLAIVDETATCSGLSSSSGSLKKVVESDAEGEEEDASPIPQSMHSPPEEYVEDASQAATVENVYHEIVDSEAIPDEKTDPEGDRLEKNVYENAIALEEPISCGAESGDSQNSTKELLDHHNDEDENEEVGLTPVPKRGVIVFEEVV